MQRKSEKVRRHVDYFNPDIILAAHAAKDHFSEFVSFHAGRRYKNFDDFLKYEAISYREEGNGVTHTVWNVLYDDNGEEISRDIVAYYTLAATSIPYEDRIRNDEAEYLKTGEEFNVEICGISAVEIKMFAIDSRYQDVFYTFAGEDLPVSAWVLRCIINYTTSLMNETLGFKALFLHSVPEAQSFYFKNGFRPIEINMQPFYCPEADLPSMYLTLREVHMNYDG